MVPDEAHLHPLDDLIGPREQRKSTLWQDLYSTFARRSFSSSATSAMSSLDFLESR